MLNQKKLKAHDDHLELLQDRLLELELDHLLKDRLLELELEYDNFTTKYQEDLAALSEKLNLAIGVYSVAQTDLLDQQIRMEALRLAQEMANNPLLTEIIFANLPEFVTKLVTFIKTGEGLENDLSVASGH